MGVHLSIESNSLNGTDSFAPPYQWVAGAEQWNLGSLQDGESASLSVVLSIRTGRRWHLEGQQIPEPVEHRAAMAAEEEAHHMPGAAIFNLTMQTKRGSFL